MGVFECITHQVVEHDLEVTGVGVQLQAIHRAFKAQLQAIGRVVGLVQSLELHDIQDLCHKKIHGHDRHHAAFVALRLAAVIQNMHNAFYAGQHARIPRFFALRSDSVFRQGIGAQLQHRQRGFNFMHQHGNKLLLQKTDADLLL